MSAFDYIESRATADSLIARFGQTVNLRRIVNSGSASEPTQTPTDYSTRAAIVAISSRLIDGENVLRGDMRGIVSMGPLNTAGVTPSVSDRLVAADGTVYRVIEARPISPAGVAVIYILQLRV